MKKYGNPVLSTLLLCMTLAACSQPVETQPKPTPPPTAPITQQPKPEQPPTYAYTAPFTGLGTNERLVNRPIMVMINNHPYARPQSGLDKADIVYEILAEGEVTRFLAIYQSQKPQIVGPVRSIRPYFIQIGVGFDAVLIHAGGSPEALETLARSDYGYLNEITNGAFFWREKFRKVPHNLYTSLDRLQKGITEKGMRTTSELPYFPFLPADSTITQGDPARKIDITFHSLYKAAYSYDEKSKRYLRFTQGKPHLDLTTNQQLGVTNLLVISAKHRILDNEGRRQVDIVGPGDGYLFQQGKISKVKWKRSGGVIRAYSDAGLTQELPLLPGNTWINVVPTSPGLSASVKYQ